MSFTPEQQAFVRECAREVFEETKPQLLELIRLHAAECPIGKDYMSNKNQFLGGWKVSKKLVGCLLAMSSLIGSVVTGVIIHLWK
jgi:hypothetical protein